MVHVETNLIYTFQVHIFVNIAGPDNMI